MQVLNYNAEYQGESLTQSLAHGTWSINTWGMNKLTHILRIALIELNEVQDFISYHIIFTF